MKSVIEHMQTGLAWYQGLSPLLSAVIQAGVSVFLTLLISVCVYVTYKILYPRLQKSQHLWDDTLIKALHLPLQIAIWLIGFSFFLGSAGKLFPSLSFLNELDVVRNPIAVLMAFYFILRFIRFYEERLNGAVSAGKRKRKRLDAGSAAAMGKFMRVIVFFIGALFVFQAMGVKLSALIAFGGASTLVVGLAAKDLLANFFGGLSVYLDRPFIEGEWISSPDKNIEGTVEKIGWRLTKVRRFNKRPLFVPNYLFSTISIENPSRMLNRQIKATIGVRYDDVGVLPQILKEVRAYLEESEEIEHNQTCYVYLIEYGDSSVNFQIYTFTKTKDWLTFMRIQEDVLLKVADIITKHGAEFAFPTRTLEMPTGLNIQKSKELV
jgi:MscS family membrane protein